MFSVGNKILVRYSYFNEETSYTIPDGVTTIANEAFSGCSSLTNVVIPNGVVEIGESAFSGCINLDNIVIPEGVTKIADSTFLGCWMLRNVTIPESVIEIEDWAFYNCASLTSVTIPDSVLYLGESAFLDCSSLTEATIGNNVTSINYQTFYGCNNLKSIEIPDGVTEIGYSAFQYCDSLRSVVIPENVTEIEEWAFHGCTNLFGVYFRGDAPNISEEASAFYYPTTIYYKAGTIGWTNPWDGCPTALWEALVIAVQPQSQSVMEGDTVTFSVTAVGEKTLSYQWYKDGVVIEGANNDSYTIESVTAEDAGNYSVLVSNEDGTALSADAALTLTQPYRATATLQIVDGAVVGLTLTDGGWGYTRAPKVRIKGGTGNGFEAHCIIENGVVIEIVIDNPGSGYSEEATLLIGGPKNNSSMGIGVSKQNGEVKVKTHLALGMTYQLWSSADCINWEEVGEPFTAEEEELDILFQAEKYGKFFKLQEI